MKRPFLTLPIVADAVTRVMNRAPGPTIADSISFGEIAADTETIIVPTRHGDLEAVVYQPKLVGDDKPAVYLNFHGGGFVMKHPEQDDPICRYLAANAGVVVINVDYDVAPGHRFPDAIEEAYDVALWASGPERPWNGARLCVGGQSAGGALAAGVARLALENGSPAVALQVLHYPPLDLVTSGSEKHAVGRSIITVPLTQLFDTAYAPSPEAKRDRLASPAWGANADELAGIAPAVIICCEFDRLHDEQVRYAEKLAAAGALRELVDLPNQDHGYNITGSDRAVVERSYALISGHVRQSV